MTKLRFSASVVGSLALLVAACGGDNLDADQFLHPDASLADASLTDASPTDASPADASPDAGASCSDGVKDGSETDVDCGGSCPDACATGKTCTVAGDCSTKVCTAGVCAAPLASCTDGIKDNGESDVDCGGANCPACADGKVCTTGTDCLDMVCSADGGVAGTCSTPSCSDGKKDGDETDTDCGGSCATKCPATDACKVDGDCASDICTPGTLICAAASCTDHVKNGAETDVDCGGGTCPACNAFAACTLPTDCSTAVCTAGACGLVAGGTTTIDNVQSQASGTAGSTALTLANNGAFEVGNTILVHQTQGPLTTGYYETATVSAISAGGVTLSAALKNTYATTGAQAIVIPELATLDVPAGDTVVAPAWNGVTGGILVASVSGAITIEGTVTMDGSGYRGPSHQTGCYPALALPRGTALSCPTTWVDGSYGESSLGPSAASTTVLNVGSNNGAGGGGGTRGQDCAAGAGGGYGVVGGNGTTGTTGTCDTNPHGGGVGGFAVGSSTLTSGFLLGGGGGEGGPDEDGAFPGAGGNGGGAIWLSGGSITVTGKISAAGLGGTEGQNTSALCAGSKGDGMGEGGGGAGGAVLLQSSGAAAVGTSLVTALGGAGANTNLKGAGCQTYPGGAGGRGRIQVVSTATTGTTNPPTGT